MLEKSNSIFEIKNKSNGGLNKNSVLFTLLICLRGTFKKKARRKSDMTPWLNIFFKLTDEIGACKIEKSIFFSENSYFSGIFFSKIQKYSSGIF